MTAIVSDVFMDRVLPLIIARASFSAMHWTCLRKLDRWRKDSGSLAQRLLVANCAMT
jgi:hypothetical protein